MTHALPQPLLESPEVRISDMHASLKRLGASHHHDSSIHVDESPAYRSSSCITELFTLGAYNLRDCTKYSDLFMDWRQEILTTPVQCLVPLALVND